MLDKLKKLDSKVRRWAEKEAAETAQYKQAVPFSDRLEDRSESFFPFKLNQAMTCPHCNVPGHVSTRRIRRKGVKVTQARCYNCKNKWQF